MAYIVFRKNEDHKELLRKTRKMKEFIEELEDCLADVVDEDLDYRGGNYRHQYDDAEEERHESRYNYRRGRM